MEAGQRRDLVARLREAERRAYEAEAAYETLLSGELNASCETHREKKFTEISS